MSATARADIERSHDVLRHAHDHPLGAVFAPKTVALIGASERPASVGRALTENLALFGGTTFLVNSNSVEILGA